MPKAFKEGRIQFEFPDDCLVIRPGKTSFYERHFQLFCGGTKETDFVLYCETTCTLWFLEVKDYTTDRRKKPLDVMEEIALKVRDSVALVCAAAANDQTHPANAGEFARKALPPRTIRVALHLEQPSKPSKLFPGVKLKADSTQSLRLKVRSIDKHAVVVSTSSSAMVPWASTWEG